jgi:hypothetical protein
MRLKIAKVLLNLRRKAKSGRPAAGRAATQKPKVVVLPQEEQAAQGAPLAKGDAAVVRELKIVEALRLEVQEGEEGLSPVVRVEMPLLNVAPCTQEVKAGKHLNRMGEAVVEVGLISPPLGFPLFAFPMDG